MPCEQMIAVDQMTTDARRLEFTSRALSAYYRSRGGDQPDRNLSDVETIGGLHYAVLRNVSGILGVYRIRNDGKLKRLVRLPIGMEG